MGLAELIQQKAFLGREFLTWLWFRAEIDPVFDLHGKRRCEVEILGPLTLDALYGDARSTVLRGESPATAPEAATALLQGKKLKKAQVKLSCDGVDWIAGIDAETFAFSGLNVPGARQLPFDEVIGLRLQFMNEFETLLNELYGVFLETRLDEKLWAPELKKIQNWVEKK